MVGSSNSEIMGGGMGHVGSTEQSKKENNVLNRFLKSYNALPDQSYARNCDDYASLRLGWVDVDKFFMGLHARGCNLTPPKDGKTKLKEG